MKIGDALFFVAMEHVKCPKCKQPGPLVSPNITEGEIITVTETTTTVKNDDTKKIETTTQYNYIVQLPKDTC